MWLKEWQHPCLSESYCEFAEKSTSTANEAKEFQTLYTHYVLVCGELKCSVLLSSLISLYTRWGFVLLLCMVYSILWLYASLPIKGCPQWSTMWFYVLFVLCTIYHYCISYCISCYSFLSVSVGVGYQLCMFVCPIFTFRLPFPASIRHLG